MTTNKWKSEPLSLSVPYTMFPRMKNKLSKSVMNGNVFGRYFVLLLSQQQNVSDTWYETTNQLPKGVLKNVSNNEGCSKFN